MTGFHLSASVVSPSQQTAQGKSNTFNVAVTFDRRRITSCNCTCASRAFWCAHVVAVCLYRIHQVMSEHQMDNQKFNIKFSYLVSFGDTSCSRKRVSKSFATRPASKVRSVSY